jgi:hypothetical protein
MLLKAKRNKKVEEALEKEPQGHNHRHGWNFPESLLLYMKQLIYKAIEEAHAFSPLQDRTTPHHYLEPVIVKIS